MRKKSIFVTLFMFFCFVSIWAAVSPAVLNIVVTPSKPLSIQQLLTLSPKKFEIATGRHLSFKEKIGFRLMQWKLRKQLKQSEKKDGDISKAERHSKDALFSGIATWAFLLIGLVVPVVGLLSIPFSIAAIVFGAISMNKTPNNTRSILGIVLGGLFLGLFVLGLLLLLASVPYF
jgi:hypothetical protein